MPLPTCMGLDCGHGRSAWGERILTLDQLAKENQQQKLRDDVVPSDAPWSFGPPQDRSQHLLELLTEQQAAVRDLLAGQAGLLGVVERQHMELCQRLERSIGIGPPQQGTSTSIAAGQVDISKVAEMTHNIDKVFFPASKLKSKNAAGSRRASAEATYSERDKAVKMKTEETLRRTRTIRSQSFILGPNATSYEKLRFRLRKIVDSPYFDMVMGLIIVLNVMCVFIQFEWKGYHLAQKLSISDHDGNYPAAEKGFQYIEMGFCAVYALELIVRLYLFKRKVFKTWMDMLDVFIVLASCVDAWILTPLSSDQEGTFVLARLLRLLRITRVLRAVKVVKFMSMFQELRVMLRSLTASVSSLLWSMAFVSFIIVAGGVLMVQLSVGFLEDESASYDMRKWVFLHFGTAARATWTIFEATFTTNWPSRARTLVFEVSPWFSTFWVFYTVVVNFAIMRVIAALFLKQTLGVAHMDEERMAMEKMSMKEVFADQIRQIFVRGDKLGDGVLHRWEFEAMMEDREVQDMFKKLELSNNEIQTLYEILSDRDAVVDYEEFLNGALKMKSASRTFDIVEILHEQMILRRNLDKMQNECRKFFSTLLAMHIQTNGISAMGGVTGTDTQASFTRAQTEDMAGIKSEVSNASAKTGYEKFQAAEQEALLTKLLAPICESRRNSAFSKGSKRSRSCGSLDSVQSDPARVEAMVC